MDLFKKVSALIADSLGQDQSIITMDTNIKEDLEADSLSIVQMIMTIEDDFEIVISEEEAAAVATVGDVIRLIEGKAK